MNHHESNRIGEHNPLWESLLKDFSEETTQTAPSTTQTAPSTEKAEIIKSKALRTSENLSPQTIHRILRSNIPYYKGLTAPTLAISRLVSTVTNFIKTTKKRLTNKKEIVISNPSIMRRQTHLSSLDEQLKSAKTRYQEIINNFGSDDPGLFHLNELIKTLEKEIIKEKESTITTLTKEFESEAFEPYTLKDDPKTITNEINSRLSSLENQIAEKEALISSFKYIEDSDKQLDTYNDFDNVLKELDSELELQGDGLEREMLNAHIQSSKNTFAEMKKDIAELKNKLSQEKLSKKEILTIASQEQALLEKLKTERDKQLEVKEKLETFQAHANILSQANESLKQKLTELDKRLINQEQVISNLASDPHISVKVLQKEIAFEKAFLLKRNHILSQIDQNTASINEIHQKIGNLGEKWELSHLVEVESSLSDDLKSTSPGFIGDINKNNIKYISSLILEKETELNLANKELTQLLDQKIDKLLNAETLDEITEHNQKSNQEVQLENRIQTLTEEISKAHQDITKEQLYIASLKEEKNEAINQLNSIIENQEAGLLELSMQISEKNHLLDKIFQNTDPDRDILLKKNMTIFKELMAEKNDIEDQIVQNKARVKDIEDEITYLDLESDISSPSPYTYKKMTSLSSFEALANEEMTSLFSFEDIEAQMKGVNHSQTQVPEEIQVLENKLSQKNQQIKEQKDSFNHTQDLTSKSALGAVLLKRHSEKIALLNQIQEKRIDHEIKPNYKHVLELEDTYAKAKLLLEGINKQNKRIKIINQLIETINSELAFELPELNKYNVEKGDLENQIRRDFEKLSKLI